jgi:hypothetical protein
MGNRNSSKTRVVPIFDRLFASDPTGLSWLPGLIQLGSCSSAVSVDLSTLRLIEGHRRTWGVDELALPAPLGLLEHLVHTITVQQVAAKRRLGFRAGPTTGPCEP